MAIFKFITNFKNVRLYIAIFLTAVCTGLITSFFLQVLDYCTVIFQHNIYLICLLPLVGFIIHFLYAIDASSIEGNNSIIKVANQQSFQVSTKMWWQVLVATLLTHIVGGSAGREGTAVQMSGSISFIIKKWVLVHKHQLVILAYAAIAAGFSAVFGTPFAAAFFAIEVVKIKERKFLYWPLCLASAIIAHYTCIATGASHSNFKLTNFFVTNSNVIIPLFLLAVVSGLVATMFVHLQVFCKKLFSKLPHYSIGFFIVLVVSLLIGYTTNTTAYFGLGVNNQQQSISIMQSFTIAMPPYAFIIKLVLTAITLGFGFKGGEVTPLFFIGAMLGNTVAFCFNMPFDVFAAIGFVTVFAVASNTPLTAMIIFAELFSVQYLPFAIPVIVIAYYCSSCVSIYNSQLNIQAKWCIENTIKSIRCKMVK